MPSSPGVAHDWHLQERLTALQTVLNSGHYLRLFANNFVPVPSDDKTKFTEAAFSGYAPASLNSDFGAPALVASGEWQITGSSHQFTSTSGTGTVYGWYITDASGNVRFSYVFPSVVSLPPGTSLYVQPLVQDWSYVTVP